MLNIGSGFINRRNGRLRKLVQTKYGSVTKETPHDRDGSIPPEMVKKRETILLILGFNSLWFLRSFSSFCTETQRVYCFFYGFKRSCAIYLRLASGEVNLCIGNAW